MKNIKNHCLVVCTLFVKTLGSSRVVPRPFPCHEPAEPLSPSLFGVSIQLSANRVLLPAKHNCCKLLRPETPELPKKNKQNERLH